MSWFSALTDSVAAAVSSAASAAGSAAAQMAKNTGINRHLASASEYVSETAGHAGKVLYNTSASAAAATADAAAGIAEVAETVSSSVGKAVETAIKTSHDLSKLTPSQIGTLVANSVQDALKNPKVQGALLIVAAVADSALTYANRTSGGRRTRKYRTNRRRANKSRRYRK